MLLTLFCSDLLRSVLFCLILFKIKFKKESKFQPSLMYPAKLYFKINGEIRCFNDNEQLKEFMTTKPILQRVLKDILGRDKNDHNPGNRSRVGSLSGIDS
ncbi:MAG: hypothetical protein HUJ62_03290 [Streptococcus gallolyticus]|nr:hypothetical protein [Streptococcus gallolyticus]